MNFVSTTLSKAKLFSVVVTVAMSLAMVLPVFAQGTTPDPATNDVFGVDPFANETVLGQEDVRTTIARLINVALSLLGVISVVIILAGGFKWMTAGGNEDKVGEAKKMIFAGVIGLAIIMSAFAIARFVLGQLGAATNIEGVVPGFAG